MGNVVKLTAGRVRAGGSLPKPRGCKDCEEPIETARLQVNPRALRCVSCEQLREVKESRALAQARDQDVIIIRG